MLCSPVPNPSATLEDTLEHHVYRLHAYASPIFCLDLLGDLIISCPNMKIFTHGKICKRQLGPVKNRTGFGGIWVISSGERIRTSHLLTILLVRCALPSLIEASLLRTSCPIYAWAFWIFLSLSVV